jgi:hypothetical protein
MVVNSSRLLFRVMRPAEDGKPLVGDEPSLLGVRCDHPSGRNDVKRGKNGLIFPGTGGLSVNPDDYTRIYPTILDMALDEEEEEQVWCLQLEDLSHELAYREPRAGKGLIEPSRPMTLERFQRALADTRDAWRIYSIEGGK